MNDFVRGVIQRRERAPSTRSVIERGGGACVAIRRRVVRVGLWLAAVAVRRRWLVVLLRTVRWLGTVAVRRRRWLGMRCRRLVVIGRRLAVIGRGLGVHWLIDDNLSSVGRLEYHVNDVSIVSNQKNLHLACTLDYYDRQIWLSRLPWVVD